MGEDSPIVKEVRQRAMRISERFGHDPRKYLEHLQRLEEREKDRVVSQVTVVASVHPRG